MAKYRCVPAQPLQQDSWGCAGRRGKGNEETIRATRVKNSGWASDSAKPYRSLGTPDLCLQLPQIRRVGKVDVEDVMTSLQRSWDPKGGTESNRSLQKYEEKSKVGAKCINGMVMVYLCEESID